MKLVFGVLLVGTFALGVLSEDYYRDEQGELYVIGNYGQRIYSNSKPEQFEKFEKLPSVLKFGWDLFKNVDQENVVVGPLSPQILLTFLSASSGDETAQEISKATGFKETDILEDLIRKMQSEPTLRELKIANGVFYDKRQSLRSGEALEKESSKAGQIQLIPANFQESDKLSREVNKWIKAATKDQIKNFDLEVDPSTKMVLASSIYFKGKWQFSFNQTQKSNFYPRGKDNEPIEVETMTIRKKFHAGNFDNIPAQWASIPYNSTETLLIILPYENSTVDEVLKKMEGDDLIELVEAISGQPTRNSLNITLPKFKLVSKVSLKEPLRKMGINKIFDGTPELKLFEDNEQPLAVDQAIQQSILEVDAEGSIGASVSTFSVVPLMVQPLTVDSDMVVDRPFIAIIVDRKYQVPYFMAKVTDPTKP